MRAVGSLGVIAVLATLGLHRHLAPKSTVVLVVTAMATAAAGWVWILASLAVPGVMARCLPSTPLGHEVHRGISSIAIVALVAIAITMATRVPFPTLRFGPSADVGPLRLMRCPEPIAFAEPGKPGSVVVSTGALAALNSGERRALFAHEHAHLRHAHHRFLVLAQASAIALPLVRPLLRIVRYQLERWADEDAAAEIGSRTVLASAMARFALASPTPSPPAGLGFASLGVVGRVRELVEPPIRDRWRSSTAWTANVVLVGSTVVLMGSQIPGAVELLVHLCERYPLS